MIFSNKMNILSYPAYPAYPVFFILGSGTGTHTGTDLLY